MAHLTRWHQYPAFSNFDGLLQDFLGKDVLAPAQTAPKVWSPRVDLKETPEAYEIEIELAGVAPEEVELTLEKGVLTLKGERKREETRDQDTLHVVERHYGAFQRSFRFSQEIDVDSIVATSVHGILKVFVKKSPEAQSKRIEIKPA